MITFSICQIISVNTLITYTLNCATQTKIRAFFADREVRISNSPLGTVCQFRYASKWCAVVNKLIFWQTPCAFCCSTIARRTRWKAALARFSWLVVEFPCCTIWFFQKSNENSKLDSLCNWTRLSCWPTFNFDCIWRKFNLGLIYCTKRYIWASALFHLFIFQKYWI